MAVKTPQKKTGQTAGPAKKQSIPVAKGPCSTGKDDKATARRKAAAALCTELKKLRTELKEIVKQVSLRIDSRIADTLRILEKKQAPGEPCNLPGAKSTAQMVKKLRALKIKPAKGKLKDIAHIERMVEKIAEKTVKKQSC
jgi:hypothetical protein